MPLDRKRKGSDIESAVSKLRKARERSTPVLTREPSPVKDCPTTSNKTSSRNSASRARQQTGQPSGSLSVSPPQIATDDDHANSFTALPYATTWHGNRTFERLPNQRLRVELVEGTGLVIVGRCTLWIKSGTVSAQGAVLIASPDLQDLSIPTILPQPTIQAKYGAAELELGPPNLGHASENIGKTAMKILFGTMVTTGELPYRILGLDFHPDPSASRQPGISLAESLNIERMLVRQQRRFGAPSVLFAGSRSSGINAVSRYVMNAALTTTASTAGVLCLDLDPDSPSFVCPGSIALCMVRKPILKPWFLFDEHSEVEIIRQHFVGPTPTDLQPNPWYRSCISDLMVHVQQARTVHAEAPTLVNVGDSIATLDDATIDAIWGNLAPSSLASIETQSLRTSIAKLQLLAQRDKVIEDTFPPTDGFQQVESIHNLSVQFHVDQSIGHRSTLASAQCEINLTYHGPNSDVFAVTTIEAVLPSAHLERALAGTIISFLAVESAVVGASLDLSQECSTSLVPTLAPLSESDIPPSRSRCLGVGRLLSVNVESGYLTVRTSLNASQIISSTFRDSRLVLVVQPPTRDGRFQPL